MSIKNMNLHFEPKPAGNGSVIFTMLQKIDDEVEGTKDIVPKFCTNPMVLQQLLSGDKLAKSKSGDLVRCFNKKFFSEVLGIREDDSKKALYKESQSIRLMFPNKSGKESHSVLDTYSSVVSLFENYLVKNHKTLSKNKVFNILNSLQDEEGVTELVRDLRKYRSKVFKVKDQKLVKSIANVNYPGMDSLDGSFIFEGDIFTSNETLKRAEADTELTSFVTDLRFYDARHISDLSKRYNDPDIRDKVASSKMSFADLQNDVYMGCKVMALYTFYIIIALSSNRPTLSIKPQVTDLIVISTDKNKFPEVGYSSSGRLTAAVDNYDESEDLDPFGTTSEIEDDEDEI